MSLDPATAQRVRQFLLQAQPDALALWAFGSRVGSQARADSDLDLALLLPGRGDAKALWALGSALAQELGVDVDLLDLRAASTVMVHQVLSSGECLYAVQPEADSWAAFALNEKLRLDEARAPLIEQIEREGTVHGR